MKNNIADTKYNVYGNEAIQLLPTNPYANGWVDCRKPRAKMTAEELEKERIATNKRKWRRQLNMRKATHIITFHFPEEIQTNRLEIMRAVGCFCLEHGLHCWAILQSYSDEYKDETNEIYYVPKLTEDGDVRWHMHGVISDDIDPVTINLLWQAFIKERYRLYAEYRDRTCEVAWEDMHWWFDYIMRQARFDKKLLPVRANIVKAFNWESQAKSKIKKSGYLNSTAMQWLCKHYRGRIIYDGNVIKAFQDSLAQNDADALQSFIESYDFDYEDHKNLISDYDACVEEEILKECAVHNPKAVVEDSFSSNNPPLNDALGKSDKVTEIHILSALEHHKNAIVMNNTLCFYPPTRLVCFIVFRKKEKIKTNRHLRYRTGILSGSYRQEPLGIIWCHWLIPRFLSDIF